MSGEMHFIVTNAATIEELENLVSNGIFDQRKTMELLKRFVAEDPESAEKYELAKERHTLLNDLHDQLKKQEPVNGPHSKAYWDKFKKEELVDQVYVQERLIKYCTNELRRITLKWGANSHLIENAKGSNLMPLIAKAAGLEIAKPFSCVVKGLRYKMVLAMDGCHLFFKDGEMDEPNSVALQHLCLGLYTNLKQEGDGNEEEKGQHNT